MRRLRVAAVLGLVTAVLLLGRGLGRSPAASAQAPFSPFGFLTPTETVTAFYAALNAREFTAAYSMLSPAAQAEQPYSTWTEGYLTTQRIDVQTFRRRQPGPRLHRALG